MAKKAIKAKGTPELDMTPMVDLAFLLVTFFMLTATSRVSEPVVVDTPSSVSVKMLPKNVILITIDEKGRPYFNINDFEVRQKTLERMGQQYKIAFTDKEKQRFAAMTSFGVPMSQLKEYINMDDPQRVKVNSPGVPYDSLHNELGDWIQFGRIAAAQKAKDAKDEAERLGKKFDYEPLRFAIKADAQTNYIAVKEVIEVFKDKEIYRFNLITDLEDGPTEN